MWTHYVLDPYLVLAACCVWMLTVHLAVTRAIALLTPMLSTPHDRRHGGNRVLLPACPYPPDGHRSDGRWVE